MNTPSSNTEPVICHAVPQETILDYAQRLFDLTETEERIQAKFNKIEFLVTREKFQNPMQISDYYLLENQKRYEEYKSTQNSYVKAQQYKEKLQQDQKTAIEEEKKLKYLSSEQPCDILEWIEKNRKTVYYMDKETVLMHLKKFFDYDNYKIPNTQNITNFTVQGHHQKIFEYVLYYAISDLSKFNLIGYQILNYIKVWKNCEK